MNNQSVGVEAEHLFKEMLHDYKIAYEYVNDWYDFKVGYMYESLDSKENFERKHIKVDVKSARISIKCTSKRTSQSYVIGRFQFTEEQISNKIWVALYIRWDDKFIFLGFLKLDGNNHKYLSIHKAREENLLSINEFKEILREKQT